MFNHMISHEYIGLQFGLFIIRYFDFNDIFSIVLFHLFVYWLFQRYQKPG